jgi:hypothetical protein
MKLPLMWQDKLRRPNWTGICGWRLLWQQLRD